MGHSATITYRFLRPYTPKIQRSWNLYLPKRGQSPDPVATERSTQHIRTQYRTDTRHTKMNEKQLLKDFLSAKRNS
jgi:hypothetical protein